MSHVDKILRKINIYTPCELFVVNKFLKMDKKDNLLT